MDKRALLLFALVFLLPVTYAFECNFEGIANYNNQKVKHTFISVYNENGFLMTATKGDFFGQFKFKIESDEFPIYLTVKDTLADQYTRESCHSGLNQVNLDVTDMDKDGFGIVEDCDDNDPNVFPSSVPVTKNDFKKDCGAQAGIECVEAWKCTAWKECINGQKVRRCFDSNYCNTDNYKPIDKEICDSSLSLEEEKTPINEVNVITGNVVSDGKGSIEVLKKTFAVIIITVSGFLFYTLAFKRK